MKSSPEQAAPAPPDPATFRAFMRLYDPALESVTTQMDRVESTVRAYNTAVMSMNADATDQAIDDMAAALDDLAAAVANWEYIETRLQSREPELEGRITQPLLFTVLGVGLAVYGTYSYVQELRQLNRDMSEARRERDEAETDTMAGMPGATERVASAKRKMLETGSEAIRTVTKQVVDQTLPGDAQTALGVWDAAGDALEGVKVFTATKACATAPNSSDCKLTRGKTDSQGRLVVPSSELAVVLSKPGKARVAVDMVDATTKGTIPVIREFIPIEIANPTIVAENDRGKYGNSVGGAGNTPGAGGTVSVSTGGKAGAGTGGKPSTNTGTGGKPSTQTSTTQPVNNTTLSGTFPGEPFNGMQITYTISGVGPSVAADSEGFTVSRNYSGPLGSGVLRVAGTASQRNGWG
ncbi:MAG: hypothetical protein ACM3ZE_01420, partial [Myxococcales bacterium]